MIGFLRGQLPAPKGDLYAVRRDSDSQATIKGYIAASGPVLRDAVTAIESGLSLLDFLVAAQRLLFVPAPLRLASVTTERVAGLGPQVGAVARAHARLWSESTDDLGRTWASALIPQESANAFADDFVRLIEEILPRAVVALGDLENPDLSTMNWAQLESLAADSGGILSSEMPGLLWLAASAKQPPSAPDVAFLVRATTDGGREQRTYGLWIDAGEARRLYEAKSKEALVEAARKAAIRDTHVDPPSHECTPEMYSLLLSDSRQLVIDDETDLLALEFLLGPLGLNPPEERAEVDWVRPLDPADIDAIRRRLEALSKFTPDELFSEAGRYLYPDRGGSEDGGYAGELQGAIREWMEEFFNKAAKKKDPMMLVACKDWLGDKGE